MFHFKMSQKLTVFSDPSIRFIKFLLFLLKNNELNDSKSFWTEKKIKASVMNLPISKVYYLLKHSPNRM